jgi:hypothetical protein
MQTNFKKAISSADNKTYIFHFNRIYTVNGVAYHISVRSAANLSHNFMMQEKNGGWCLGDLSGLPQWLIEMEKKFEAAIIESL